MYSMSPARAERPRSKRNVQTAAAYLSESALRIVQAVENETGDASLKPSIHFSAGVVERVERELALGCTIVADSNLVQSGIDRALLSQTHAQLECFMDDPVVVSFAMQKHITRAEVAIERTLSIKGPKLIVVGSAPMALKRLLQLHQQTALHEVVVIAAAAGFASAVELKERIWESGLPCIVVRGRKGGANAAIAVTNALLRDALQHRL
ncbi:MAG: precorrin-8X methylmutase [Clostridia bacterium]|nr:precorrin-8X methylmutase [Clostridia bacterium]